ncbi:MAG: hypothetical protein ACJAZ2_001096 [Glaciecola sp.]|jgi:hypothetical protein
MRNELENIALIEAYIAGELLGKELAEVETKLLTDDDFNSQLTTQQNLQKAIARAALRKEMAAAGKTVAFKKVLKNWIIGGAVAIATAGSVFYFMNAGISVGDQSSLSTEQIEPVSGKVELEEINQVSVVDEDYLVVSEEDKNLEEVMASSSESTLIPLNQPAGNKFKKSDDGLIDFNGLKMWVQPDVQTYKIDPSIGGLIDAKDGTVIVVPENAFIDDNGATIKNEVEVKVLEAVELDDMVLYNLTTTANGKALQTGGMLHFEFLSNGKKVNVNPKRPLYIEVPTEDKVAGMMAFKGKVKDGKVDWENPKPLKKYLVNVDFDLLDFLPEGFDDAVETELPFRKYKEYSSSTVDKIYYNLSRNTTPSIFGTDGNTFQKVASIVKNWGESSKNKDSVDTNYVVSVSTDSLRYDRASGSETVVYNCGINPTAIKSIRSSQFRKSYLATKEFEKRIAVLHASNCGREALEVYINNLDKDLCYADSIVVTISSGDTKRQFKKFANENLTNIRDANIHQKYLSQFYNNKLREYDNDQRKFNNKILASNNAQIGQLRSDYIAEVKRSRKLFNSSGSIASNRNVSTGDYVNTPVASRNSAATSNVYSFQWASAGWVNIDAYLHLLSKGSKGVVINYEGHKGTTEVYQYLSAVDNLTPLLLKNGTATIRVPKAGTRGAKSMENTFCMAISKEGKSFKFAHQRYNPYKDNAILIKLLPSSEATIRNHLRTYGVQKDLAKRMREFEETVAKMKRKREAAKQKRVRKAKQLAAKLKIAKKRISDKKKAVQKKQVEIAEENRKLNVFKMLAFRCDGKSEGGADLIDDSLDKGVDELLQEERNSNRE